MNETIEASPIVIPENIQGVLVDHYVARMLVRSVLESGPKDLASICIDTANLLRRVDIKRGEETIEIPNFGSAQDHRVIIERAVHMGFYQGEFLHVGEHYKLNELMKRGENGVSSLGKNSLQV